MVPPPVRLSNFDDAARIQVLVHLLLTLAQHDPLPGSQDPQFAVAEFLADCRIPSTLWPEALLTEHPPEMDQTQLQSSLAAMLRVVSEGKLHGELRLQRRGRVHVMLTAFDGVMVRMEIAPNFPEAMLSFEPGAPLRRTLALVSSVLPYALREDGHEEFLHAQMVGLTELLRTGHHSHLPV